MKQALAGEGAVVSYLTQLGREHRTGEVLLQYGDATAKVYLNNGLVVWAFATGQKESFQSILLRENRISKEVLLEGIRESRRSGKRSLDEILICLGETDAAVRRQIIHRHTHAALRVILDWQQCAVQFNACQASIVGGDGLSLEELLGTGRDLGKAAAEPTRESAQACQLQEPTISRPLSSDAGIKEILEHIRDEVPAFLAAMVIDGSTAMPVAAIADASELDVEAVGAFYLDIIRSSREAAETLGRSQEKVPVNEILITGPKDFVLLYVLAGGEHFLYLLTDRNSNPGMARVVVRRYVEKLNSFLS